MDACVGATVVDVLEEAGERHLRGALPELYQQFLLQVGGTDTLRRYDHSAAYWERVQAILDCFFTSAQRAEICSLLMQRTALCGRAEFRSFWASAVAERRMPSVVATAVIATTIAAAQGDRSSAHYAG